MLTMDFNDYDLLRAQVASLIEDEEEPLPVLANLSALFYGTLKDINWIGFYLVKNDELILGPFQGKMACMHIPMGKGVCGTAAFTDTTQLVPDVHAFPGHIACDGDSRSELVIPLHDTKGRVAAVLDIDSPLPARFDVLDQTMLEDLVRLIETACDWRLMS